MEAAKKTPLYTQHVQLKAKIINFGGWDMPVSYESVLAEHHTVRKAVGLFDVSHMGEVRVHGPQASEFLNFIMVNDVKVLSKHQGQYSAMCNEQGGVIDDLILYKLGEDEFFICVNAGNSDSDFAWIKSQSKNFKGLTVENESEKWAQIAVQGPFSTDALRCILSDREYKDISKLEYMHIAPITLFNHKAYIARTGYTGEKGYEIYLDPKIAEKVWVTLLERNQEIGIKPIGLGARDTLRLEATYLLYGNDMDTSVSPLEAGINWAVKFNHNFIGKDILQKQKEQGPNRKLIAFKMVDSAIPRHGMYIWQNDKKIGLVTSGSVLPTLGGSGGLGLIIMENYNPKEDIIIDVRGHAKRASVVPKPLYSAKVK